MIIRNASRTAKPSPTHQLSGLARLLARHAALEVVEREACQSGSQGGAPASSPPKQETIHDQQIF